MLNYSQYILEMNSLDTVSHKEIKLAISTINLGILMRNHILIENNLL